MIMADVLKIFLLIVGTLMVLNSCWLAAEGLFPSLVLRCSDAYSRPVKVTLLGLILAVPPVLLAIAILGQLNNPLFKLIGGILLSVPFLIGLAGSAGLAKRIGRGLHSSLDTTQPWRQVLRGGIVLSLTFVLPLIGWFFLLPWALISGFGAMVVSRRKRSSEVREEIPVPDVEATN